MNFKITNDDDDNSREFGTIKVEVTFHIDTWNELCELMENLENEFGE